MNVLEISPIDASIGSKSVLFKLPDDRAAAVSIWVFLVENLKEGFVVDMSANTSELTRVSGHALPPELYGRLMSQR